MDQEITRSKSDIVDKYREKIQPENRTLWYPHRDCQRSRQQALQFYTLNSVCEVVGAPGEAVICSNKNVVIDRVESLGHVDEDGCTVLSVIDGSYDIV